MNVRETENDFDSMLGKIVEAIDALSINGDKVSLLGASGGGSMAVNAFIERQGKVEKVVNVCGRLRIGRKNNLDRNPKDKQLLAYNESVRRLDGREKSISESARTKILTVSPSFGQEFVPSDTVQVEGAGNIKIVSIEHVICIFAALTLFSGSIMRFLLSNVDNGASGKL